MTDTYIMRADKASYSEYGNTDSTEFILKYTGISNPFSLGEDDLLVFPEENIAKQQMVDMSEKSVENTQSQIRNYFKFQNKEFKSNRASYDAIENLNIPSGVPTEDEEKEYSVPYVSTDGKASISIRNGRMYFGEDNSQVVTNMDQKIQNLIDSTATALADKCAINGLSLTDFVRASVKNQ